MPISTDKDGAAESIYLPGIRHGNPSDEPCPGQAVRESVQAHAGQGYAVRLPQV